VLQIVGDHSAALSKLFHALLVQPNVHFCRASQCSLLAEVLGELFSSAEAAVELEQLHEIDN
jgi:hypothetical protein